MQVIKIFLLDEAGSTALEYSMIGGLISIVVIVSVTAIGSSISDSFLGPISNALAP